MPTLTDTNLYYTTLHPSHPHLHDFNAYFIIIAIRKRYGTPISRLADMFIIVTDNKLAISEENVTFLARASTKGTVRIIVNKYPFLFLMWICQLEYTT